MQLSMGYGEQAYKMYKGKPAKLTDVINIFDRDKDIDFVDIKRQKKFYDEWLKSL